MGTRWLKGKEKKKEKENIRFGTYVTKKNHPNHGQHRTHFLSFTDEGGKRKPEEILEKEEIKTSAAKKKKWPRAYQSAGKKVALLQGKKCDGEITMD